MSEAIISRYFHGTLSGPISQFRPLSHFGTSAAARHVCARKWLDYKRQSEAGRPVIASPVLIEVELNVSDETTLYLKDDWGTPNVLGVALALRDHYGKIGRDDLRAEMHDIWYETYCRLESEADARTRFKGTKLEDFLVRHDIQTISYPNKVEGVRDEISICVIDPQIIEIIDIAFLDMNYLKNFAEELKDKLGTV